jgi:hypothetical protein
MKNKIAIASAFIAASSFSMGEIVVNEFLSFEGFVDTSYSHVSAEAENVGESDNSFGVDQVEIDWLFSFGNVSAQVDIDAEGSNGSNGDDVYDDSDSGSGLSELEIEQAFVNFTLASGDVVTAGRYGSMLGFEALEPTGLYQHSTAYNFTGGIDLTSIGVDLGARVPGISKYAQGVKYTRTTSNSTYAISVQDQSFGTNADRLGGDDDGTYGLELAASRDLGNGFNVFVGAAFENADSGDQQLINTYVTYETGAWLFAAELNLGESQIVGNVNDMELQSGLLMANYAYSDIASVTARVSDLELELGANKLDLTKFTVAHNYALSDNLLLVTEISSVDGDIDAGDLGLNGDGDSTELAVELLFTF